MTPGRLEVDAGSGKVTGPAHLTYNDPFPTLNGSWGSHQMMGVLEHTMAGNLPGTVSWFNNPASNASAHFGVSQGEVHQFGPILHGWIAWHAAAANPAWYGIEFADNQDPANPLTSEQVTAAAQLVEMLSRVADFPLQVTDSPDVQGYGTHSMGGAAFGGHLQCPGSVRSAQRTDIVAMAKLIRDPSPVKVAHWHTLGLWSLAKEAAEHGTTPEVMIRLAAEAGHVYGPAMKAYVAAADWDKRVPVSTVLYAPAR